MRNAKIGGQEDVFSRDLRHAAYRQDDPALREYNYRRDDRTDREFVDVSTITEKVFLMHL